MSDANNNGATVSNPSPISTHTFNIKAIPTFHERLIVYIILTDEVGAPSEKYVESFLDNFARMIHKGNCVVTDKLADTLSEILANGDAHETTGGVDFLKKLPAGKMPELNFSAAPDEQPIPATETPATPAEAAALDVFAEVTTAPAETAEAAASPAADETSELDVFAALVDDENPEKEYATTSLNIRNVKRDGNSIEVILYRLKSSRSMSVYYEQTKKTVTMPYRDGVKMFDNLDDGGKVTKITTGAEKRTYATLNLTLDDMQAHFSDKLDSLTWEPRTKKRNKFDSDRPSEG